MVKITVILLCGLAVSSQGRFACAEAYSECRVGCDSQNADCSNQPQATEPEVQAAQIATCEQMLQSCYADCENLKPVEPPTGTENNPNIIRK